MHKLLGTIAVGLLALSSTACSMGTSPDGSPDEPVGEAKQASTENPTFPSADSGTTWVWSSPGGTGADFVTMSNALNQTWEVTGYGSWPSYVGMTANAMNIDDCEANSISFYSYYYCSAWDDWAGTSGEQIVSAVAYTSGGKITACQAQATAGPIYFSCATEWNTDTYTDPTGTASTYAIANPL